MTYVVVLFILSLIFSSSLNAQNKKELKLQCKNQQSLIKLQEEQIIALKVENQDLKDSIEGILMVDSLEREIRKIEESINFDYFYENISSKGGVIFEKSFNRLVLKSIVKKMKWNYAGGTFEVKMFDYYGRGRTDKAQMSYFFPETFSIAKRLTIFLEMEKLLMK